ncbi:RNA-binding protein, CCR4-NOT complex subunit Rcd1 [Mycoemilia scoparia]|uniref:RNA-binding protein, CCR4-NOT complex subunit Rcd1 n=1 Tax=Mycoemilia scoparia TaxID=417184 RepID=A0A9W8DQL8_9FUNG|nr:RNA-binding protein, CCR4-NOT complex subunit Rcd1 [Mycoemilia scoparia]
MMQAPTMANSGGGGPTATGNSGANRTGDGQGGHANGPATYANMAAMASNNPGVSMAGAVAASAAAAAAGNIGTTDAAAMSIANENLYVYGLMVELFNHNTREQALSELSKRRDQIPDLAVALWNSIGVMSILYQEIISVYPLLTPETLSLNMSNRVCNALALLQLVATHEQTRMHLLRANVPQLLYPLLNTAEMTRQFDNLRLTSLGVIGALVKYDNPELINFFVTTEFLPLCLKIMEIGSELCKVVATFIFQKIIGDDGGFNYITSHPKRLRTVIAILNFVVEDMVKAPSSRLLKSVSKCFLRLADDPTARKCLQENISPHFKDDNTFQHVASEDATFRKLLYQIHLKIFVDTDISASAAATMSESPDSTNNNNTMASGRSSSSLQNNIIVSTNESSLSVGNTTDNNGEN